jgi:eukaryotic-like serine/threonine-protein kinase
MAQPPGTRLGPYEIRAPLGAGGMGEVYRARDTRLKRDVAIKVLPQTTANDPTALARFRREAQAVAALQHPNILALYDVGVEHATTFAVMELLEGETLRARISDSPVPWRKAVAIGVEIAEGLAAAHAKGVIHRDLKPENVFLTRDGRVKILDFGLARYRPSGPQHDDTGATMDTEPGTIMGTAGYMSPEQVRGEPTGASSDLFALGCVLHEMIAGRRAFAGRSSAETMAAILTAQPPPLTDLVREVPPELERWITHCLEKDPAVRSQSARDLAFALRTLLGGAPAHPKAIASLAVLPFFSAGDNPDSEYLCDGITETIINGLAQLPGLRVLARSTVFRHKGDVDPIQVGYTLCVGAVLTGRVFQRGEILVIGAELVDVASGSQLWGQHYKRKLADIFEIQDDIATELCENLRLKLTGDEQTRLTRRYTEDPAAYQLYLKGRYCWNQRTEEGMRKAVDYFLQAIEKDPTYARAYTGLGDAYAMLSIYNALPPNESFPKAKAAQRRALEIADDLAEAHASLGFAGLYYDWEPRNAEAALKKAIALNPGYASAHQWYGFVLGLTGRMEESIAELRLAQQLDPFSASINVSAAWPLYWMRRHEEAVGRFREAVTLHPGFWLAHYYLGLALEQSGFLAEAIAELEHARDLSDSPWRLGGLGHAYALAGRRDEAYRIAEEAKSLSARRYVAPIHIASVYAGLGDAEAFEWLEKGLDDRSWLMTWLEVDPLFDPIRQDERFGQLSRRVWRVGATDRT